jgi:hypothetical protein
VEGSKKKVTPQGNRKGKEHVKKTKDIEDTKEVYVKVPLHESIPPSSGFVATKEIAPNKAFCTYNDTYKIGYNDTNEPQMSQQ